MEAPPTSPAGDPTADADADSESRAMTIISYPSRVWKSLAGSEQNVLSKLRIPSFSGLNLNFLLRSQSRRHGLPLPMHSTSAHSFRVVRDKTKPFALLEEIVETTLSHIHATQKSLLFWQSRAEGTSSQKIYFMVFERGPRAFAKEMCRVIASLYTKKSSFKYLSDSASDMISTKLAILTSLQHSLSTFLAEVYLEVNQYKEVLNDGSENSLSKSLVIIDGLFSKLETSLNHHGEINKDVNLGEIKFEKLQEADREREEWTEEEIKEATNLIYRNLQLLNSHLSSIFLRSEKPRRAAQYWVRYTAGAIGLSVCSFWIIKHSRLTGSSDIDNWIRDAKESITTFYKEHVEMPLLSIRDDLFETFKKRQKGVMEHEEVQLTADSLRRMLLAFCEQTKGQKLVGNLSDQDLMEIVMSRYEKEVMHPLQNLLSGELARAMLIQIQKLKLDLETAMLELDQILKANEINFAILAALPAFFFSVLLLGFLRKWILQDKGAEGRGRIARRQRRLLLVEIEKRLMQFQSYMDKGMDEEARCRFGLMLYSLDRLYKSVERHATETGEWISLRQDIVDLSKPDLGTEHKLVVVSRVERMYDCLLPSSSRL